MSINWIAYSILCLVSWGLWGLFLKIAYKNLDWVETYFLSSIASFTISLIVFMVYSRGKPIELNSSALPAIMAGVLGGLGYIFFIKALEKGKASIVLPLTALYPAITVLLALMILDEKISLTQAIGIVLALIAVVLMSL